MTPTVTAPEPAGETAVIWVSELTTKLAAAVPPKLTAVAPVKPVPVMTTLVPPAARPGRRREAGDDGRRDVGVVAGRHAAADRADGDGGWASGSGWRDEREARAVGRHDDVGAGHAADGHRRALQVRAGDRDGGAADRRCRRSASSSVNVGGPMKVKVPATTVPPP